jgi:hypothetical protein
MPVEIKIFGESADVAVAEMRRLMSVLFGGQTAAGETPQPVTIEHEPDAPVAETPKEPELPLDASTDKPVETAGEPEPPRKRRGTRKTAAPLDKEPYVVIDAGGDPHQPCDTADLWAKELVALINECASDEEVVALANHNGGEMLKRLQAEKEQLAIDEVARAVTAKREQFRKAQESVTPKEGETAKEPLDYIRDGIRAVIAAGAKANCEPDAEILLRRVLQTFGANKASEMPRTKEAIEKFTAISGDIVTALKDGGLSKAETVVAALEGEGK